jgi:hypothetical protein
MLTDFRWLCAAAFWGSALCRLSTFSPRPVFPDLHCEAHMVSMYLLFTLFMVAHFVSLLKGVAHLPSPVLHESGERTNAVVKSQHMARMVRSLITAKQVPQEP